jgi:hypothetical protein
VVRPAKGGTLEQEREYVEHYRFIAYGEWLYAKHTIFYDEFS